MAYPTLPLQWAGNWMMYTPNQALPAAGPAGLALSSLPLAVRFANGPDPLVSQLSDEEKAARQAYWDEIYERQRAEWDAEGKELRQAQLNRQAAERIGNEYRELLDQQARAEAAQASEGALNLMLNRAAVPALPSAPAPAPANPDDYKAPRIALQPPQARALGGTAARRATQVSRVQPQAAPAAGPAPAAAPALAAMPAEDVEAEQDEPQIYDASAFQLIMAPDNRIYYRYKSVDGTPSGEWQPLTANRLKFRPVGAGKEAQAGASKLSQQMQQGVRALAQFGGVLHEDEAGGGTTETSKPTPEENRRQYRENERRFQAAIKQEAALDVDRLMAKHQAPYRTIEDREARLSKGQTADKIRKAKAEEEAIARRNQNILSNYGAKGVAPALPENITTVRGQEGWKPGSGQSVKDYAALASYLREQAASGLPSYSAGPYIGQDALVANIRQKYPKLASTYTGPEDIARAMENITMGLPPTEQSLAKIYGPDLAQRRYAGDVTAEEEMVSRRMAHANQKRQLRDLRNALAQSQLAGYASPMQQDMIGMAIDPSLPLETRLVAAAAGLGPETTGPLAEPFAAMDPALARAAAMRGLAGLQSITPDVVQSVGDLIPDPNAVSGRDPGQAALYRIHLAASTLNPETDLKDAATAGRILDSMGLPPEDVTRWLLTRFPEADVIKARSRGSTGGKTGWPIPSSGPYRPMLPVGGPFNRRRPQPSPAQL